MKHAVRFNEGHAGHKEGDIIDEYTEGMDVRSLVARGIATRIKLPAKRTRKRKKTPPPVDAVAAESVPEDPLTGRVK